MTAQEANFDGLIGPTHHYGGLSPGNVASQQHRHQVSSPRRAALQGLAKMKRAADMGTPQAFLPPQPRPDWRFLAEQGFEGDHAQVLADVKAKRPELLSVAFSASSMWTANAATVSPSADTSDGRVHFTPANLQSMPHRRIEANQTSHILRTIFHDARYFVVHDPVDADWSDEGAANHTRLCRRYGEPGVELFVYGREADQSAPTEKFVARQTKEACEAIARQHGLDPARVVFAQQSPEAIDSGVFHNDVIAVGNMALHLVHEKAYVDQERVLAELADKFGPGLQTIVISDYELKLKEAVSTYFFNSQLLTSLTGTMTVFAPVECGEVQASNRLLSVLMKGENPIVDCQFVDLRESMQNGGGPACLRLRVVLTEEERAAIPKTVWLTDARYRQLKEWIQRHYRDRLHVDDLADSKLAEEVDAAMEELTGLLGF